MGHQAWICVRIKAAIAKIMEYGINSWTSHAQSNLVVRM